MFSSARRARKRLFLPRFALRGQQNGRAICGCRGAARHRQSIHNRDVMIVLVFFWPGGGKAFFFEKKQQKTSFASFLQKRSAFLPLCLPCAVAPPPLLPSPRAGEGALGQLHKAAKNPGRMSSGAFGRAQREPTHGALGPVRHFSESSCRVERALSLCVKRHLVSVQAHLFADDASGGEPALLLLGRIVRGMEQVHMQHIGAQAGIHRVWQHRVAIRPGAVLQRLVAVQPRRVQLRGT